MEAVGLIAAGVQIVDVCARLSGAIYKLRTRLKDAPADIQRKSKSTNNLLKIVLSLRADFQAPPPSPIRDYLSQEALLDLLDLLQNSSKEIVALNQILQNLQQQPQESLLRKQERNLRALSKQGDIRDRLNLIHDQVGQLELWYNHQLLKVCTSFL